MTQKTKKPVTTFDTPAKYLEKTRLSSKQNEFFEAIKNNQIIFCTGPAGTAKTWTALYSALSLFSLESKYKQIFLVKPIKESGENLGFLPGDIKDKTDPYLESFVSNIDKLIPEELRKQMFEWHQFEFKPLAYMRGATYDNTIIIADEIQNATHEQLILALTRLGKNSKLIVLGDTKQVDINRKNSGLLDFINMLDGIGGVYHHIFERSDIVRNKILIEITDRYDTWLASRVDKK